MNLDQIARDAARDARQAAREMPIVPIGRLRRRRLLLTITPLVAVGLAAWVAILVFSLPSENPTPPADTQPTPTTVDQPTATTTVPPTTTTTDQVPVLDADWVRGTYQQIVDDQGQVLYEFPFTILYGRNTAWDGDDGFVALTESGLIWMRPEGRQTIDVPQGSIVDIAVTEAGTHVIGIESLEDGSVSWVELETGNECRGAVRDIDHRWRDVQRRRSVGHDRRPGLERCRTRRGRWPDPTIRPSGVGGERGWQGGPSPPGRERGSTVCGYPRLRRPPSDNRGSASGTGNSADHRLDHRSGVRRLHPDDRDARTRILRSDRGSATGGRCGAASPAMNDLPAFRVGHPAAITGPSTYLDPHLMLPVRSIP